MTTKATILRAIRGTCLDCSCEQPSEVRKCTVRTCPLWPFRMGLDPHPSPTRGFGKSAVYTGDFGKEHATAGQCSSAVGA